MKLLRRFYPHKPTRKPRIRKIEFRGRDQPFIVILKIRRQFEYQPQPAFRVFRGSKKKKQNPDPRNPKPKTKNRRRHPRDGSLVASRQSLVASQ